MLQKKKNEKKNQKYREGLLINKFNCSTMVELYASTN